MKRAAASSVLSTRAGNRLMASPPATRAPAVAIITGGVWSRAPVVSASSSSRSPSLPVGRPNGIGSSSAGLAPAEEDAAARAQHRSRGQDRRDDEDDDDPAVADVDGRVLEHPLARERAQERRPGQPERAREEDRRQRPRHLAPEAVEPQLVDAAGAVDDGPDGHEQPRAQQPVGGDEQRRGGDALGAEQAHPDQRHPDLADGHEREQALEVVLGQAHHRSPQRGHAARTGGRRAAASPAWAWNGPSNIVQ